MVELQVRLCAFVYPKQKDQKSTLLSGVFRNAHAPTILATERSGVQLSTAFQSTGACHARGYHGRLVSHHERHVVVTILILRHYSLSYRSRMVP